MRVLIGCALVLSVLFLVGCKRSSAAIAAQNQAQKGQKITALFYPQYIMLLNITDGTDVQLSLVAPPDTGCLHDYQLTVRDMQTIADADIIVINGAGMETFAQKALTGKTIVDASKDITLIENNPHVWVSLYGAAAQTETIAAELAVLDAKNAGAYRKNAQDYMRKLGNLNELMHTQLDQFSRRGIVVFHEAFPYLADEFTFTVQAVIEHEPGTEPSAKELLETVKIIQNASAAGEQLALFAEKQYPSTAAEVIARETGLTVHELDSAVTGVLEKDAYLHAMKQNMSAFTAAFREKK